MPSGKTHDMITLLSLPILGVSTYVLTQDPKSTTLITSAFLFSGSMFSGDLDLKSKQYNRWGPLKFIWIPYQKMFSHRSIWTHGVFTGTAIRILYLALWVFMIAGLLSLIPTLSFNVLNYSSLALDWIKINPFVVSFIITGLLLGSLSHTGADVTVSWFKKTRKKKLRPISSRSTLRKRTVQKHTR